MTENRIHTEVKSHGDKRSIYVEVAQGTAQLQIQTHDDSYPATLRREEPTAQNLHGYLRLQNIPYEDLKVIATLINKAIAAVECN